MIRIVRCACGLELRSEDEGELIRLVRAHAKETHDLALSDDAIRDLIEFE